MARRHFALLYVLPLEMPITTATITLSSKGQVVTPKVIWDELHWDAGPVLTLVSSPSGVTLKAVPKKTGRTLADLIGMFKHEGPPLSTEELCKPVDYSEGGNAVMHTFDRNFCMAARAAGIAPEMRVSEV